MQLNGAFFTIAMGKLSLFKRSPAAKELLHTLSDVTGIPMLTLLYTEKRMCREASLLALKELLNDGYASRADRLKYRIGFLRRKDRPGPRRDRLASRFTLTIRTERGTVDADLNIVVQRSRLAQGREAQRADLSIRYKITTGAYIRRYRQSLALTGMSPSANGQSMVVNRHDVRQDAHVAEFTRCDDTGLEKTEPVIYHFADAA